ncbi:hydrogenase small subunit [Paenibacillus durus]|uniref:[NiFe] hydrogenase small subunit HydA n=1 Tax=Paenibacillus durus ATCC 35681 TaxID=1333534 RepID=A0A0F7CIS9_PAEDU|nr:hydrogenase small subunit [Paenibacillus durus]AKG35621.1 [NiFe] hydrogenase small subunit HydA [Paenibacillus durus ATCC 35681]
MRINRRDFLKWSVAAVAALKLEMDMDKLNTVMAADTDPPVIWLLGSGCSGCSISTLNVTNPTTIEDVLQNKISMKYDSTLMAASGESAMQALENAANQYNGQFILVIEGAIPGGASKNYCIIGEQNGVPLTMYDAVLKYGPKAKYVVAAGTCASFGGVAAAAPNSTGCVSVKSLLGSQTANPIVNLAGCPVNATVMVQTLLDLILTGVPSLDANSRPSKYFGTTIHSVCPRKGQTQVTQPGIYGCYKNVGCKGPGNQSPCPSLKWNNKQGWCIQSDYPCIGCTAPAFPLNPIISVQSGS